MPFMFTTNQGVGNSEMQSSPNTSSKVQQAKDWNTQNKNQPITAGFILESYNGVTLNSGANLMTTPAQQ